MVYISPAMKKFIIFIIALVLVVSVIFILSYFGPSYTNSTLLSNSVPMSALTVPGYKASAPQNSWTTNIYKSCPGTVTTGRCILPNVTTATSVCNADPACIGFWGRAATNWLNNDGKIYYELTADSSSSGTSPSPAIFYTKATSASTATKIV